MATRLPPARRTAARRSSAPTRSKSARRSAAPRPRSFWSVARRPVAALGRPVRLAITVSLVGFAVAEAAWRSTQRS